ncbi:MAG: prepilin-type N-terminal cleavage/methylation domain-containing protein [Nitrosomonadales bacterium]|nr:prepilin-type N-terminal cleavage/methylation domain-containing protein [Nitrosomonadales bacterium]
MKRNQSGFTLIEIAIVLVIIGLLLGGVLKGQELINSAKVKNLATDFKNIPVFIYGYQDKFKALPGDQTQAVLDTQFTPAGTAVASSTGATLANGVINGNWNDQTTASESYVFWQHVRLAGLAPGATDTASPSTYLPTNAAGGSIGVQSGTNDVTKTPIKDLSATPVAIRGSYVICSTGILGKFVKQLDNTMDDNNTATGSMMAGVATAAGTPMTAVANGSIDDATTYTVCMGV